MTSPNEIILDLYREAQDLPIQSFDAFVIDRLGKLVEFDSAIIAGVRIDSASAYTPKSLHLHNQPIEKYHDRNYWEKERPDPMLVRAYRNPNRSVSAELGHLPEMSKAMLAYAKKYEVSHSLTFCAPQTGNDVSIVGLWRAKGGQFLASDLALSDLIFPHVVQAQRINRRHHALELRANNLDSISLIAGRDCAIMFVCDAAIRMIQQEWPQWHPPLLPRELVDRLAGSRNMFFKGRKITVQATMHEDFLCLNIKPLPSEGALTVRELECLALVRAGKTSAEMAAMLGISERTANFHITNAMQKLGAGTRRHAAETAAKRGLLAV